MKPDENILIEISDAIRKSKLKPEPVITAGGSDANPLNTRGIWAVNIGIGAQNPHANNEFILINDLAKSSEIAKNLIMGNQQ